jgi:hypothetical protein
VPESVRRALTPEGLQIALIEAVAGLVMSTIVLIGAIQMLRMRTFGVAVAGAIVAMLNLASYCCLLGLPFGIWALVVLFRPEVRGNFE